MLLLAFASIVLAFGWLALAMEAHWRQVRGKDPLERRTVVFLRTLGALGLTASLFLCLAADDATIAPLVWVMALAAGAAIIALALAWGPRLLAPLVAWARSAHG